MSRIAKLHAAAAESIRDMAAGLKNVEHKSHFEERDATSDGDIEMAVVDLSERCTLIILAIVRSVGDIAEHGRATRQFDPIDNNFEPVEAAEEDGADSAA